MHSRSTLYRTGARGVCVLLALSVAGIVASNPARAETAARGVGETDTVAIVIEGPSVPAVTGKAEVQLRIFDAEDPDAPPNVTNIAVQNVVLDPLAFPISLEVAVPKSRLLAAMRPAVGVIIIANGTMAYWSETIVPLDRTGSTTIRVAPVP